MPTHSVLPLPHSDTGAACWRCPEGLLQALRVRGPRPTFVAGVREAACRRRCLRRSRSILNALVLSLRNERLCQGTVIQVGLESLQRGLCGCRWSKGGGRVITV